MSHKNTRTQRSVNELKRGFRFWLEVIVGALSLWVVVNLIEMSRFQPVSGMFPAVTIFTLAFVCLVTSKIDQPYKSVYCIVLACIILVSLCIVMTTDIYVVKKETISAEKISGWHRLYPHWCRVVETRSMEYKATVNLWVPNNEGDKKRICLVTYSGRTELVHPCPLLYYKMDAKAQSKMQRICLSEALAETVEEMKLQAVEVNTSSNPCNLSPNWQIQFKRPQYKSFSNVLHNQLNLALARRYYKIAPYDETVTITYPRE